MNLISWNKRQFILFFFVLHLTYSSATSFATSLTDLASPFQTHFPRRRHRNYLDMASSAAPPRGGGDQSSRNEEQESTFRRIRKTLIPIHGKHEVRKFLLIGSIKFFIIMALTLTRDTKDTLVVTQCGAEAIAFLKVRQRSTHR